MSIQYHVYANNGAGGPVDFSTIVVTVSSLTWTTGTLALGSDTTLAVRAFDTVSGHEEQGITSTVRIHLDGAGNDLGALPLAPVHLAVRQAAAGVVLTWVYLGVPGSPVPTGFKVWFTAGGTVNYLASPAATVPGSGPGAGPTQVYSTTLTETMTDGNTYSVGVRAYNTAGTEPNTTAVAGFTAVVTPPAAVDGLTATTTAQREQ